MRPLPPIRREVLVEAGQEKAFEDDRSVATGFFTVQVRPWQVMLQA
jgi:hypothetical protein